MFFFGIGGELSSSSMGNDYHCPQTGYLTGRILGTQILFTPISARSQNLPGLILFDRSGSCCVALPQKNKQFNYLYYHFRKDYTRHDNKVYQVISLFDHHHRFELRGLFIYDTHLMPQPFKLARFGPQTRIALLSMCILGCY